MKIFYDIETKGLAGKFLIGGLVDEKNNYHEFEGVEEFLQLLSQVGEKSNLVFAHNGGKYDHRYIFEYLMKNDYYVYNIIPINSSLYFKTKIDDKEFEFRDTYLLFHDSLKNLSESFDVKHKKVGFSMEKWINNGCPITDELKNYLKHDVLSLKEIYEKFEEQIEGDVKITIASTSFDKILNSKYEGKKLKDITENYMTKEHEDKIRKSYKGGRCEVFKRYGKDLFYYDVNSLYPHVMNKYKYPYGDYIYTKDENKIKMLLNNGLMGILKVKVESPKDLKIPYLAKHHNSKLFFPLGKWEDYITSIEYTKSKIMGYDFDIIEGFVWDNKGYLFKNFINKYYDMKKNSSGAKREIAKRFLNTSYGKFGQRRDNYETIMTFEEALEKKIFEKGHILSDDMDIMKVEQPPRYNDRRINPLYATFITAYARHEFYSWIELIKYLDGTIYYCDTDSITTDLKLNNKYLHDSELGKMDLEREIKEGVFVSNKLYALKNYNDETILKMKGIPYDYRDKFNFKKMKDMMINNSKYKVDISKVSGLLEQFTLNKTDKNKMIEKIETQKEIRDNYDKRKVLDDNIHTKAIKI